MGLLASNLCTVLKWLIVVCVLTIQVKSVHSTINSDVCEGPCPQTCQGVDVIHAGNIDSFQGCSVIEGSISIFNESFNGFQKLVSFTNPNFGERYPGMHPDKLEAFNALKEVTGFVNIQGYHSDFRNLSYFRNLEVIGGRTLTFSDSALYITTTSLRSLGLKSLKKVSGRVAIKDNAELCYAEGINWSKFKQSESLEERPMVVNNRAKEKCITEGSVCDRICAGGAGCWGPGPDQCVN